MVDWISLRKWFQKTTYGIGTKFLPSEWNARNSTPIGPRSWKNRRGEIYNICRLQPSRMDLETTMTGFDVRNGQKVRQHKTKTTKSADPSGQCVQHLSCFRIFDFSPHLRIFEFTSLQILESSLQISECPNLQIPKPSIIRVSRGMFTPRKPALESPPRNLEGARKAKKGKRKG